MKFSQDISKIAIVILLLQILATSATADAAELVFCVNKSTRVVTYPASGKCASNTFALNVSNNAINLPKSHTTTAAIAPKSGALKVFIPNVLAMDPNKAKLVLTNLGLKVSVKMLRNGPKVKVLQVVPKVMSPVTGGSVVTIVVG
jgi:hypothetical protein